MRTVSAREANQLFSKLLEAAVEAAATVDLDRAMRAMQRHHLTFRDAMLSATARRAGCRMLISADGHDGRNLAGVTFVNPCNDANAELLGLALPRLEPD